MEDLCQKAELSRNDILLGVREKYSAIQVARKKVESARQEAAREKKKSGGGQAFVACGSEKNGGQAGGRGKSRGDSAGGKKSNKPSTSSNSSSTTAATATTEFSKCQAEGLCPKQRYSYCGGKGSRAEVCPNLEAVVMVYKEISDGQELEVFMVGGQSGKSFWISRFCVMSLMAWRGTSCGLATVLHLNICQRLLVTGSTIHTVVAVL